MTLQASGLKDRMSRRDFLKIIRLKKHGMPHIDKEKCSGCGLCAMDCPTKALTLFKSNGRDSYQLLFQQKACNACGTCQTSCPEHCLRVVEKEPEKDETGKKAEVIFEDEISRCRECGISLFPQSMVKKLESKIFTVKENAWPFHLCPSCRMKSQFTSQSTLLHGEGKGEGDKIIF